MGTSNEVMRNRVWFDIGVSIFLVFLSVLVGGFGIYMLGKSYLNLPYVFFGIILWGGACIGVRRLIVTLSRN